jgi:cephalosporin hydroxylase
MFESARRTRPRRRTAPEFFKRAQRTGPDGRPEKPVPIPDELKVEFTDAFWRSNVWRDTLWLGRRVPKCPTDLLAYQELLVRAQPDWVIETNTAGGGRALFLASVCDLLGRGEVLSIDDHAAAKLPEHPRILHIPADPACDEAIEKVREIVGDPPNAVLILGLAPRRRLMTLFESYAPLVPVGSYVVFEETITNGNPVWPGMGPGPMDAIKDIRKRSGDFVPDPSLEKFGLTFSPSGFLKRRS